MLLYFSAIRNTESFYKSVIRANHIKCYLMMPCLSLLSFKTTHSLHFNQFFLKYFFLLEACFRRSLRVTQSVIESKGSSLFITQPQWNKGPVIASTLIPISITTAGAGRLWSYCNEPFCWDMNCGGWDLVLTSNPSVALSQWKIVDWMD